MERAPDHDTLAPAASSRVRVPKSSVEPTSMATDPLTTHGSSTGAHRSAATVAAAGEAARRSTNGSRAAVRMRQPPLRAGEFLDAVVVRVGDEHGAAVVDPDPPGAVELAVRASLAAPLGEEPARAGEH